MSLLNFAILLTTAFLVFDPCQSEKLECQKLGSFDRTTCTIDCKNLIKNSAVEYDLTEAQTSLTLSGCIKDKLPDLTTIDPQISSLTLSNGNKNVLAFSVVHCHAKLSQLEIRTYTIKTLTNKLFAKCLHLKWLELKDNSIETIAADTFVGLESMTRLDLTQNSIRVIGDTIFKPLKALKNLHLDKNNIQLVTKAMFADNPRLEAIDVSLNQISNTNEISTIKSLEHVYAASNQLKSFTVSENHSMLILSNNSITELSCTDKPMKILNLFADKNLLTNMKCIEKMTELNGLYLSRNKFTTLDASWFKNLKKVQDLHIAKNPLVNFDPKVFSAMSSVHYFRIDVLADFNGLRAIFPKLDFLQISVQKWDDNKVKEITKIVEKQKVSFEIDTDDDA